MSAKLLGRDAILAAGKKIPFEDVPVEELGGTVRIRGLTAAEHGRYTSSMMMSNGGAIRLGPDGKTPMLSVAGLTDSDIRLLAMCIIDEQGARVFADEDVAALAETASVVVEKLVKIAKRLSGLEQNKVAELAKNSETGPSAGLPIG